MGHCAVSPSLLLKYFKEKNVRRPIYNFNY